MLDHHDVYVYITCVRVSLKVQGVALLSSINLVDVFNLCKLNGVSNA